MSLNRSASEVPVPDDIRAEIIQGLWQQTTSPFSPTSIRKWDAYFHYYATECRNTIQFDRGQYTTVREHIDIATIAKKLEDHLSKDDVKKTLLGLDTQQRSDELKDRMAEGSTRLVARLIAMVDIGPVPHAVHGRPPIPWTDGQSNLKDLLAARFKESSTDAEKIKFDGKFTAFNLRRFAGIEVQWSNNLADHMRLIDNDTKICIFHHVTFLKFQNSAVFPKGLAEETLRTLALLFPRNDDNTREWLESQWSAVKDTMYLDLDLLDCDRLLPEDRRAEKFRFWRDELLTLKEKFEEPHPTSIVHFWYDRRNKVQWYTFWIAALVLCLTIFFGLVQSIEGALQVYKAYHPTPQVRARNVSAM